MSTHKGPGEPGDGGGFLSRWSRRKVQVKQGVAPELALPPEPQAASLAQPVRAPGAAPVDAAAPQVDDEAPPLTLDDVAALTPESDFRRFIRPDVQPEVKNAALKKLFHGDPHYNLMDGLDTYIDDYGKPDPLPASMLRQMVQSKALGLFDAEEAADKSLAARQANAPPAGKADDQAAQSQSSPAADDPAALPPPHDPDPDLQLQPDDAAGHPGAASGARQDRGREH